MSFFAELEIGYFEDYLNLIKTTIENDSRKLNEKVKELENSGVKPITSEDGQEWDPYEELADEKYILEGMEQLMYRTYVIGVLVFIEDQINNVCASIQRTDELMFSYKDLKGMGVSRAIKYLKTVTKKDFPAGAENRKHFEVAIIIRNSLVHQDGQIDNNYKTKIQAYITEHPNTISLTETDKIQITYNYAKTLLDLSRKINLELEVYNRPLW